MEQIHIKMQSSILSAKKNVFLAKPSDATKQCANIHIFIVLSCNRSIFSFLSFSFLEWNNIFRVTSNFRFLFRTCVCVCVHLIVMVVSNFFCCAFIFLLFFIHRVDKSLLCWALLNGFIILTDGIFVVDFAFHGKRIAIEEREKERLKFMFIE